MTEKDFIPSYIDSEEVQDGKVTWKTPSNIALVKYWGKTEPQLPKNTSISFTLDACFTKTFLSYKRKEPSEKQKLEVYFEGEKKDSFKPKIQTFLTRIEPYVPFLKEYHLRVDSQNSFPHSSGIASSASGMGALALCVMSLEEKIQPVSNKYFKQKASFLARLGSGSACRSIEGGLIVWGKHDAIPKSSDLYGISFPDTVHPIFKNFHDTILLVDKGEKQVSSTVGHQLMHQHPFAEQRFLQAQQNISKIKDALITGNINDFMNIVESEALSLHAMMMTSNPYFILMKPNTLHIIHKIWHFRKTTGIPICFTLDAGANVHVLYPENKSREAIEFIKTELLKYCQKNHYICDRIGKGSIEITKKGI